MKLSKILLISVATLMLTACSKVQTLEYYKEHPDKAKKVVEECNKNKDKLSDKELENCSNAAQAHINAMLNAAFE